MEVYQAVLPLDRTWLCFAEECLCASGLYVVLGECVCGEGGGWGRRGGLGGSLVGERGMFATLLTTAAFCPCGIHSPASAYRLTLTLRP